MNDEALFPDLEVGFLFLWQKFAHLNISSTYSKFGASCDNLWNQWFSEKRIFADNLNIRWEWLAKDNFGQITLKLRWYSLPHN